MNYELIESCPTVQEYLHLRKSTGLSEKTTEAATRGLAHTWFGVSIKHNQECVGMGRIIGDDGCFFQIVDIAVLPDHQGQGLGTRIMQSLIQKLHSHAPKTAIITLLADGEAHKLYEKFGFIFSAPKSLGMILHL